MPFQSRRIIVCVGSILVLASSVLIGLASPVAASTCSYSPTSYDVYNGAQVANEYWAYYFYDYDHVVVALHFDPVTPDGASLYHLDGVFAGSASEVRAFVGESSYVMIYNGNYTYTFPDAVIGQPVDMVTMVVWGNPGYIGLATLGWITAPCAITETPSPTPTTYINNGGYNAITNGNFEMSLSSGWGLFDNSPYWRANNDSYSTVDSAIAFCGTHYARVHADGLTQRFWWPGGTAYIHARILPATEPNPDVEYWTRGYNNWAYPQIEVRAAAAYDSPYIVANGIAHDRLLSSRGMAGPNDWSYVSVQKTIPSGWYDLLVYNVDEYGWHEAYTAFALDPNNPSQVIAVEYPAGPSYQFDDARDYLIDDVTISGIGYLTHCSIPGGPTATPVPTASPMPSATASATPTATTIGAPTATPSRTPTAAVPNTFFNCSFEGGSAGWLGTYSVQLAGGPIGPQYSQVPSGSMMYQPVSLTGGATYLTFWLGPNSNGEVALRNALTGYYYLWRGSNTTTFWRRVSVFRNSIAAGNYNLEVRAGVGYAMNVDGVSISNNTYSYCGGNVTPTAGPTSFITPTPTLSPTPGPTRTAWPATATGYPTVTRTPNPTWTQANTSTPMPTHTQLATQTQLGPEMTSTAQGTPIATYTPYPTYTPWPTGTPYAPPPQQPDPGPSADCVRPQSLDPAAWIDYNRCVALSWISWSPSNTASMVNLMRGSCAKEPFGMICEVRDSYDVMQRLIQSYDWTQAGLAGQTDAPDVTSFTDAAGNGWYEGDNPQIDLLPAAPSYGTTCDALITPMVGPMLSRGVCFGFNTLRALGLMPFFQLFVDISCLIGIFWMAKKNVDKWGY